MSDDEGKGTPSLEPPSFFGRKKRAKKQAPAAPEPAAASTPPLPADADIRPEIEPVPPPQPEDTPTTILDADQPTAQQPSIPPASTPFVTPPAPPAPPPPTVDSVETVPPGVPELPKAPRGPWLTGWAAALVTGLVVGGLIVGGTAASLRLCTAVRGTESCGNAGFPLLLVILVAAVLLGAVLLRAARVPEPGSTSFLAVGLLSVVALLFLIDQLLEWWMVILIPIVSVLTYLLAHWVTTTYIEPASRETAPDSSRDNSGDSSVDSVPELRDIR